MVLFLITNFGIVRSQKKVITEYQFCSPEPNSFGINPETAIVIRYGEKIDINTLSDECIKVTGEISGPHSGKVTLNKDQLTLSFQPDQDFTLNEKVSIYLNDGIKTIWGKKLPLLIYGFTIRQEPYGSFEEYFPENSDIQKSNKRKAGSSDNTKGNSISFNDIPEPLITCSYGATAGNIMTVLEKSPNDYLYLFNKTKTLLFARKTPNRVSNFKPHLSGLASYFDHNIKGHILMNQDLNNIDTLFMKNGYNSDAHDILLLENGHYILEAYDPQRVDMSKIAVGGDPNATVIGFVIQELDENKNLLFEWRSWDHFRITDSYSNLLSSIVDWVHGNSLDADTDSTLIFSSRDLNEITKISRLTGKVIWRLGGKNNEFLFLNDPRGFSAQHSVMKQKNGNLTIFDNGDGFFPIYSRGIEYKLDELNKTVTLIREYRHDPDVFAYVTGNFQKLGNGNSFIFWGSIVGQTGHIITEYNPSGDLVYEVRFDLETYPTYASYSTNWEHNIFRLSTDSVNFGKVVLGDSVSATINIINLSKKELIIKSAYGHDRDFIVEDLPISVGPLSTKVLKVKFHPRSEGPHSDILTICQENDSSIIAQQLIVTGVSPVKTALRNELITDFEMYPNPADTKLNIKTTKMVSSILICNLSGKIVRVLGIQGKEFTINLNSIDPGFYILVINYLDTTKSMKRLIKLQPD